MAAAQPAVPGFFPLDEELGLLPGCLTPRLSEALVRLSTHILSFTKAAHELAWFTGTHLHPDTARRRTEAAGAVLVAHETAEATRLLSELPTPSCSPDTLVLRVDGAMVPLVGGQWTEVRTLAVGELPPVAATDHSHERHTIKLSSFSRRLDRTTFRELALGELHRRGLEGAGRVAAVVDGAAWCQSFIDLHAPQAVRMLDFAHAAEYLTRIGQAPGPKGVLLSASELTTRYHSLKHNGAKAVLPRLRELVASQPDKGELKAYLSYLEARTEQMSYPQFSAAGWPIGSGMVESANTLVVEDRLKGAGMHWADANVNPLLALRNAVCNDRWEECWRVIEREQHRAVVVKRQRHQVDRQAEHSPVKHAPMAPPEVSAPVVRPTTVLPVPAEPERRSVHPWRRAWSVRRQREVADTA